MAPRELHPGPTVRWSPRQAPAMAALLKPHSRRAQSAESTAGMDGAAIGVHGLPGRWLEILGPRPTEAVDTGLPADWHLTRLI